ncbi:hypothetical protein [Microbacterium esteraromaticum]|uniref:hypothetical protein n=1 Tax=Microbacterium esteraromaticum TaxID=57043 RepID=UPI0019D32D52|nr:hypothetical protein [Microbacterium esteraromaticum]MBN7792245.1 hypothetical protein [Microbacterium esteraromaticum]
MSTSNQDGQARLTRKQLREIRLTGSTPVITDEEASADATPEEPAQTAPAEVASPAAAPVTPDATESTPEQSSAEPHVPLTRRAARAQERIRTGSVPLPEQADAVAPAADAEPAQPRPVERENVVSAVPGFAPAEEPAKPASPATDAAVSAPAEQGHSSLRELFAARAAEAGLAVPDTHEHEPADRPKVGAAFGIGVRHDEQPQHPTAFDDLLGGGSSGSHSASTALIFTPSPGVGSLSGPVASTGELLITGTYALPDGLGSQGHAVGTTDGKEADAVLIDGELAPASSPTPIAAASAVATSKPAGEVIRPPAPDKGNKLMLTLAIIAGGLALALAAALIIAFTTRVLG